MKPSKFITPKPKRPRGRPVIRIIEPIDATPEEMAQAMFRAADRERDERGKKTG